MRHVITDRKETTDDSLQIRTLSEEGGFRTLIIPGIRKSRTRSSYHYYPGNIFDFILNNSEQETGFPKESNLVFTPLPDAPDFTELDQLAELTRLVNTLPSGDNYPELFETLWQLLRLWKLESAAGREELLNFFVCGFLQSAGYLNFENSCAQCGRDLDKTAKYFCEDGGFCGTCEQPSGEEAISWSWLNYYLTDYSEKLRKWPAENRNGKRLEEIDPAVNYKSLHASERFRLSGTFRGRLTRSYLVMTGQN